MRTHVEIVVVVSENDGALRDTDETVRCVSLNC
jgi:hypothetical protein